MTIEWVRSGTKGNMSIPTSYPAYPPAAATPATPKIPSQAVVMIHGIGEQRPMDTIKAFVDAAWVKNTAVQRAGPDGKPVPGAADIWSQPDARTGSLELRRITTRHGRDSTQFPAGVRTDFYELYWADLTAGTPWEEFTSWIRYLLFRPLSHVPHDVRLAYWLLWAGAIIVVVLGLAAVVPATFWKSTSLAWLANWQWLVAAIAVGLTALLHFAAQATFSRVARYTRADPVNIAARAAVRERGLMLLRKLHDEGLYERVIVVSHSLGTMLAHDLIGYFWAEREAARTIAENTPEFAALCALEQAAADVAAKKPDAIKQYAAAQRRLRIALGKRSPWGQPEPGDAPVAKRRWLISNLVTLGSPLTHAEFLIAADKADLDKRKDARELPESPPFREYLNEGVLQRAIATGTMPIAQPPERTRLCSYSVTGSDGVWRLHHAAPFAAVKWTNIFDPAKLVIFGDIIGGPVRDAFGPAVTDVDLRALRGQSWTFTHTKYWTVDAEPHHIEELRKAVDLLDEG
jgi:hypothetical protein